MWLVAIALGIATGGCVSVAGGDARVAVTGELVLEGAEGSCELSLAETRGGRTIARVFVNSGTFKRSLLFHSRQRIDDPVEFSLQCGDGSRRVVASGLAIASLTNWRHPTDLGLLHGE